MATTATAAPMTAHELEDKMKRLELRLDSIKCDDDADELVKTKTILDKIQAAFGSAGTAGIAGTIGTTTISERIERFADEACELYHAFNAECEADPAARARIEHVMRRAYYVRQLYSMALVGVRALHQVNHVQAGDDKSGNNAIALFCGMNDEEMNKYQQLLIYLLNCAYQKGYRRKDDACYREICDAKGRKLHAWERACSIEEFIYDVTRKEFNFDMWMNLTSKQGMVPAAAEYLLHCKDSQFLELKRDRRVFAFKNGTYLAKADAFVPCGASSDDLAELGDAVAELGNAVACKFFDLDFDRAAHATDADDWYHAIATPHLQSILDFQEFEEEVCRWMYVFVGRLIYEVGELDRWQVIPYLKGQACSGKSTILLKVCKNLFEREDVGVLSNNMERKFGLSAFCDKYMFVAPEIKGDMQMEQAEFQSIVSGEDVLVNVKYQKAKSVVWTVPGIMAGNEMPNWSDNAGSVVRRVVLFEFEKKVERGDMDLGHKLEQEMAAIVLKCNRAYRWAVGRYAKTCIWSNLPSYFATTRSELTELTNAMEHFLLSDKVRLGAELYMPVSEFESNFLNHCIAVNLPRPRGGVCKNKVYKSTLSAHAVRIDACASRKEYPAGSGVSRFGAWILGVDAA